MIKLDQSYTSDLYFDILEALFGKQKKLFDVPKITSKASYWKYITKMERVGEVPDMELQIYMVEHHGKNDPRVSLTKEIFKTLDQSGHRRALVALYNEENLTWRLSLVTLKLSIDDISDKIVKTYSNARRLSFLLGVGEKVKTPEKCLNKEMKTFQDLQGAFNVEVVRKEFFAHYIDLYIRLYREVFRDTALHNLLKSQNVDIVNFTKTLLGKIVFLYFIQKKWWLWVPRNGEYGKNGDKDFMRSIWNDFKEKQESLTIEKTGYFYNDYLEWLFFEGLNRDRRDNQDYFTNLQMRVPYLNGGLFKEDYQGWEKNKAIIANEIFSNAEQTGILDIFDTYNFTIDEDDLHDKEVAVDPEMLGKIFEKMISISHENIAEILEEYEKNEQSGKKKKVDIDNVLNKKLGAFYTPREIVHYMCQESLVQYLVQSTKVDESRIRDLIKRKELSSDEDGKQSYEDLSPEKKSIVDRDIIEIDEKLQKIKILDPAIGSGAFPMGLLHEISWVRWYFRHHGFIQDNKTLYDIKKETIQNNIYGVDISPGAIDIARLRFWLTLIVDEETPEPLPNFEFKFVCANTLIQLSDKKWLYDNIDEEKLREKVNKWYGTQSNNWDKNDEWKEKLQKWITEILQKWYSNIFASEKEKQLVSFNPFISKQSALFFDYNLMFWIRRWEKFDIVIGNPPYIKEYDNRKAFDGLREMKYYMWKMDLWYYFACYWLDLLKEGWVQSFIAQNNWITSFVAKIMRNKILEEAKIREFIDFWDFKVFETAGIQTMIYILEKTKSNSKYEVKYSKLENADFDRRLLDKFLLDDKDTKDYIKHYSKIEKSRYVDKTLDFVDDIKGKILEKIYNEWNFRLEEKEVVQGIVWAPDKYYLVENRDIFTSKEQDFIKIFHTNVWKYQSWSTDKYIVYLKDPTIDLEKVYPSIYKHFEPNIEFLTQNRIALGTPTKKYFNLHRERDERFFQLGEKIVCWTRVQYPSFFYTEDEYYWSRALNFIKTDRTSLKFLTAILNSNLSYFWLKNKGKLLWELLQIDKSHLLNIPIKNISPEDQKPFIEKVDQILTITKQPEYNPKKVPDEQKKLEQEIDAMVYELYGLSAEEVRIVDESLRK